MSHQVEASVTINVELADASSYPTNTKVGKVYEVAINGQGYMIEDGPNREGYERTVVGLDPQRLATGETPFSQAIERYTLASHLDFSAGAGQQWLDRPDGSDKAFWRSEHVDPFTEPGKAQLLRATASRAGTFSYVNPLLTVLDRTLFCLSGQNELRFSSALASNIGGAFTLTDGAEGTDGTLTVHGLTNDGQYWYAASGRSVLRGITTDPAAAWSEQNAFDVVWSAGRICAAVASAGSTPNRFTTLNDSGAEEVTNGHLTLPEGHTIELGGSTGGFFFFGAYAGSQGSIYAWKLGLDEAGNFHTPFQALELPGGLIPVAVGMAGGSVWVKAYRPEGASAGQAILYRCVPDAQGALTPFFVTELAAVGTTVDHTSGGFATTGDLVLFTWTDLYSTSTGVGAVDLVSGGWAKWLHADAVTGVVPSVAVWQGRPVFSVAEEGPYVELDSTFEQEGLVDFSILDGGSLLDKVVDEVVVATEVLDAGESVDVWYTPDGGGTYTSLGSLGPQPGLTDGTFTLSKKGPTFGVRTVLNGDGTSATALTGVTSRYHQLGLADTILQLPILCSNSQAGVNGQALPENGPGRADRAARELLALGQTRVKVQDIDWAVTGVSEIFEVVQVRRQVLRGVYEQRLGRKVWEYLVLVTLRKEGAS